MVGLGCKELPWERAATSCPLEGLEKRNLEREREHGRDKKKNGKGEIIFGIHRTCCKAGILVALVLLLACLKLAEGMFLLFD